MRFYKRQWVVIFMMLWIMNVVILNNTAFSSEPSSTTNTIPSSQDDSANYDDESYFSDLYGKSTSQEIIIEKSDKQYLDKQFERHKDEFIARKDKWIGILIQRYPYFYRQYTIMKNNIIELVGEEQYVNFLAIAFGVLYVLFCIPLMHIAGKVGLSPWMAWIPIIQILLMLRMGEKGIFWFLLLLIPIVNIFAFMLIWIRIAYLLRQPSWLGILMVIPGVNILVIWYLDIASEPEV